MFASCRYVASMWKPLCALVLLLGSTWSASLVPCPQHCQCGHPTGEGLHASCDSFEVLRKLQPKQARTIESLTVTNITDIDPKIKILRNLKRLQLSKNRMTTLAIPNLPNLTHLNVSSNYLRRFSAAGLPRSLTSLDLSDNLLGEIPKDLVVLENLRNVNLAGNPVICSCALVEVRDALKDADVTVGGPVLCAAPPHLRGTSWGSDEICPKTGSIWDQMLGDAPVYDGSGSGDSDSGLFSEGETGTYDGRIEDEFLTDLRPENSSTEDADFEGSGDDIEREFRNNPPKPCYINCTIPPPLNNNDTNDTISALDGVWVLLEDISGKKAEDTTTTKATTTEVIHEETFVAVTRKPLESVPDEIQKTPKNDEEANNATTTAPSTALPAPKKSKSTYILLAVLCIVIVMIIVFAIYKTRTNRRSKKRRQTDADNGISKKPMQEMTELAPLTKVPETESNSTHLTNGTKNGKAVEESDSKEEEKSDENDGVELRQKQENQALLTPEAKRVTIKAGEIPGSVPRTPLLVNRHISSDGNVITTPTMDQRL